MDCSTKDKTSCELIAVGPVTSYDILDLQNDHKE